MADSKGVRSKGGARIRDGIEGEHVEVGVERRCKGGDVVGGDGANLLGL